MRNKKIRRIVFASLFAAMASILKIFSLQISNNFRISFFPIPIILAGYYLGPLYGLLVGFITDTTYIVYSPYASFYSIYTISTLIWGISGYFIKLSKTKILMLFVILAITSLIETSINTLAMFVESGDFLTSIANLPNRLIVQFVRLPLISILTYEIISKFTVSELDFSK